MNEQDLDHCARCQRPLDNDDRWNATTINGRIVQRICPDCQTPEEAEEAVHRLARGYLRTLLDEARLLNTATLLSLNKAVAEGGFACDEKYFQAHDGAHLFIPSGTTDPVVGVVQPITEPIPKYVEASDGSQIPYVPAPNNSGFILEVPLANYIALPMAFTNHGENDLAKRAVAAQIRTVLGSDNQADEDDANHEA